MQLARSRARCFRSWGECRACDSAGGTGRPLFKIACAQLAPTISARRNGGRIPDIATSSSSPMTTAWSLQKVFNFEGRGVAYDALGEGRPVVMVHGTPVFILCMATHRSRARSRISGLPVRSPGLWAAGNARGPGRITRRPEPTPWRPVEPLECQRPNVLCGTCASTRPPSPDCADWICDSAMRSKTA
jgi:hypothetical protein